VAELRGFGERVNDFRQTRGELAAVSQEAPDDADQPAGDDHQGIAVLFGPAAVLAVNATKTVMATTDDERSQEQGLTPSGCCDYLVYSGGPMASFYRPVEPGIPDVEMAHRRPVVHPGRLAGIPGTPARDPGYRLEASRLSPA
jgi:hypothetical protein